MSEFKPGDGVVYRPHPNAQDEDGDVVRVTEQFVFVRFVGDRQAKAVAPSLLEHAHPGGVR